MSIIACVNGKTVSSDKQMSSIVNTRITFTDGSWCNVSTGEVHNVGPGYITIGGPETNSDTKRVTEGPKQVSASALEIRGVVANVHVDTHRNDDIEYIVTGTTDQIKAIRATVRDTTLVLEDDGSSSSGGGITIVGGDIITGSIFRRGNMTTVISSGNGGTDTVNITIRVPQGTPVKANRVLGNVVIGDTDGPLTIDTQGSHSTHAGRITSAQVTVQGSGSVHIQEANGTVIATVQGSGDIEIKDGSMPSLIATVQGSGDINVGGSATTANLTVMGSGDIQVTHVQHRPIKSVVGSGDIRVRRVG